jgi:para-nitrobenzyl esterase
VIDGETLPESPIIAIEKGKAAGTPVMLGWNRDEVKQFVAMVHRDEIDDEALLDAASQALPNAPKAQLLKLITLYRNSRMAKSLPHSNLDIRDAIETDARTRHNAIQFAAAQAGHQPNTFLYLFTHESPARRGALGACHSLEMPFVFGTLDAPTQDRFAGTGPEVERLSANMMDAWLLFARNGNLAHEGIGDWPAYNTEQRPTMIFGPNTGVQFDPFGEERAAVAALS